MDRHHHLIFRHLADLGEGTRVKYISLYDETENKATWQRGVMISDLFIPLEDMSHKTFCTEVLAKATFIGQISQADWVHHLLEIANRKILFSFECRSDKVELKEIHLDRDQLGAIAVNKNGKFLMFVCDGAKLLLLE